MFQPGATKQHVHLSFLYTLHAYSSQIYHHTTKVKPILFLTLKFKHEYIDKYVFLGQGIYFKTICYLNKNFCSLRKYV